MDTQNIDGSKGVKVKSVQIESLEGNAFIKAPANPASPPEL